VAVAVGGALDGVRQDVECGIGRHGSSPCG
jgi:hypothetical protein